ncbi:MAG: MFS transporter [Selenomonadaceae bacterium]|nr:MFS transporter [Selenomonadaceae bacterium]
MLKIKLNQSLQTMQQHSTRAIFFINGFGAATWAPLVPFLRERLAITEDTLGMLLLCIGIGSLIAMPIAGTVAAKFGCRKVLTLAGIIFSLLLLMICNISNLTSAVIILLLFGTVMGCLDVVMNIQAVMVEKSAGRRMMSGMHAMWSVGGFVGAGLFGIWVGMLKLTPFTSTIIAAVIMLSLLFGFANYFLPTGGESSGSIIAIPRGIVVFFGIITCIAYLVEGAIMDWSGVFLTTAKGFDISLAGVGFTMFSAAMFTMRLIGDRLVQIIGQKTVVIIGSVITFVGFMLLIFAENQTLMYAGFFLIGIGSANVVPVFFSLIGKQKVMPVNMAVPAVSTLGYAGVLLGPAVIGFLAHQTSLFVAFGLLAGLVALQLIIANYIFKRI